MKFHNRLHANARPEDTGQWSCELESYTYGKCRGYGYIVNADFDIDLISKTPMITKKTSLSSSNFGKISFS